MALKLCQIDRKWMIFYDFESNRAIQVLFPAPNQYNPNRIFQIGNGFGFFLFFQSQRYNTLNLARKVSVQGAEIP